MSDIDRNSLQWRKIEAWAQEKLAEHRSILEKPGTDIVLTEASRTGIAVLNELLLLPEADENAVLDIVHDYGVGT